MNFKEYTKKSLSFVKNRFSILNGILVVILILAFFIMMKMMDQKTSEFRRDYTLISDMDSLNGKVDKIYFDHGYLYINLGNSKLVIQESKVKKYLMEKSLDDLIREGDFLLKKKFSDTINIHKKDDDTFFMVLDN